MLSTAPVNPTLPVVDMARAKAFYVDTLGLKVVSDSPAGTLCATRVLHPAKSLLVPHARNL